MRVPYILRYALDNEPATLARLAILTVQIIVLSMLWYMDTP